jgi:hypothetical protein
MFATLSANELKISNFRRSLYKISKYIVMSKIVQVNGYPLRMVEYTEPLYRGDEESSSQTSAHLHYSSDYHKFFATQQKNTISYIKNKIVAYVKKWSVLKPLYLVDIMDGTTRDNLVKILPEAKPHFDFSFPIVKNKVYRVSEQEYMHHDNGVLRALCTLRDENNRPIDGYIMKSQVIHNNAKNNNMIAKRIKSFHAEVGLCQHAFHKLHKESEDRYKMGVKSNEGKPARGRSGSITNISNEDLAELRTINQASEAENVVNEKVEELDNLDVAPSNQTNSVRRTLFGNNNNNNNNTNKLNNAFQSTRNNAFLNSNNNNDNIKESPKKRLKTSKGGKKKRMKYVKHSTKKNK